MCHLVVPARMLGLLCIFKSIFTSNIYRAFKWWYFDDTLQMQRSLELATQQQFNHFWRQIRHCTDSWNLQPSICSKSNGRIRNVVRFIHWDCKISYENLVVTLAFFVQFSYFTALNKRWFPIPKEIMPNYRMWCNIRIQRYEIRHNVEIVLHLRKK